MYNWSLDELYTDFGQSYQADLDTLTKLIQDYTQLASTLEVVAANPEVLINALEQKAKIMTLIYRLYAFASLRMSTNSTDNEALSNLGKVDQLVSALSKPDTLFDKWIVANKDSLDSWSNASDYIKEHHFILNETIENSTHLLNEDVEEALSLMKINASTAWSQLQGYLTSTLTQELDGKQLSLTEIRNLAYDEDQETRKRAYLAELELYKQARNSIAYSINSIKGEVNQEMKLRHYNNALEKTLIQSRVKKETLDALLSAIEESFPVFRKYFKHKAKLLGHKNGLPWYDMFASVGSASNKQYSIEESREYIVNAFSTFSPDMAAMAARAYDEKWIDFLPYSGKRGGAFCSNLPFIKQSRILSNYGYTLSDIVTLAHELGHAYHGYMIEDQSILNSDYTMPVAETASTFCENIVLNAALKEASDEEKISLLESSLQDLAQITVDIYSRYTFEDEVFKHRQEGFLFPDVLEDIMINAQKKSYGDGLDENYLNSGMWICKGHYYEASLNYYNFPYAFGGLFALGLYGKFKEEGQSFVPLYQNLLKATTTATCEDVAAIADIDVTKIDFWRSSLQIVEERVEEFIRLTSN